MGELATILALAGSGVRHNSTSASLSGSLFATQNYGPGISTGASCLTVQVNLVAGTGFEPVTFRL